MIQADNALAFDNRLSGRGGGGWWGGGGNELTCCCIKAGSMPGAHNPVIPEVAFGQGGAVMCTGSTESPDPFLVSEEK
jgi:hypothetical protein